MSRRLKALLFLLALVVIAKAGTEWARWVTSEPERTQLHALREEALDAGVEVVRIGSRSDTLFRGIERADSILEQDRARVERYARFARDGSLPSALYAQYRRDLERYNKGVEARNRRVDRWRALRRENERAVARYNRLADSIRAIAATIGEPYYPVPAPIEAAAERGLIRLEDP